MVPEGDSGYVETTSMCCCCFRTAAVDQLEVGLLQYKVSCTRAGKALVGAGFCGAGRCLFYEVAMRLAGI